MRKTEIRRAKGREKGRKREKERQRGNILFLFLQRLQMRQNASFRLAVN